MVNYLRVLFVILTASVTPTLQAVSIYTVENAQTLYVNILVLFFSFSLCQQFLGWFLEYLFDY